MNDSPHKGKLKPPNYCLNVSRVYSDEARQELDLLKSSWFLQNL